MYEGIFTTVREINRDRAPDGRLRIVLCDSPIDWSRVQSTADYEPFANRMKAQIEVLGPEAATAAADPATYRDTDYVTELRRRARILDAFYPGLQWESQLDRAVRRAGETGR